MIPPRYQDIRHDLVPEVALDSGVSIRVLCGSVQGVSGPVKDIVADPEYLDVTVPANTTFEHQVKDGYTVLAYVIEGSASFAPSDDRAIAAGQLGLYEKHGTVVTIAATDEAVRFLLISGKPIGEPVAWYGPIVMNTKEELNVAFEEYRNGTFLKNREAS
jgi:hypothetical protein